MQHGGLRMQSMALAETSVVPSYSRVIEPLSTDRPVRLIA